MNERYEPLEQPPNEFRNSHTDFAQRSKDQLPGERGRGLGGKRYIPLNGTVEFHFYGWAGIDDSVPRDLCVRVVPAELDADRFQGRDGWVYNRGIGTNPGDGYMECLVPVEVRELVEPPQRVVVRGVGVCVVKLLPLNECLLRLGKLADSPSTGTPEILPVAELGGMAENRELHVVIDRLVVQSREFA